MVGRKLSAAALAGSIAVVAFIGGCRDEAPTGPSSSPSSANYAANLRVQGGDVQTGPVALPLPTTLKIKVIDAGGQPVQGASVTWSVLKGGGSVNPPTGISDVNGFVTTSWTLGVDLGDNTVRAYLHGSFVLDSVTFAATAVNGSPVTITVDSTTLPGAAARVASTLSPLSFVVTDQFGHPVPGATVNFAPSAGSGTASPTAALTNADGRVSTLWTLGTGAVTQTLTATLNGQLPMTLAEPTVPDTSRRITIIGGNNQSAPVASSGTALSSLPQPLSVLVTDRFNNPIANEAVTFGDSIGNGDAVAQPAGFTDAGGQASATFKLGALAGPHLVRVKTPGSGGQFVRFSADATVQFRDIFVGNFFTCGVGTNNLSYCWGFGQDGQLGNIALVSRSAPNWPVTSTDTLVAPAYTTFRSVSGGKSHACGVAISRRVFCWGVNSDGRQFMLPPTNPVARSQDVAAPSFPSNSQLASTRLVSAGESFSCALTLGGIALCSGNDELGQLGNGFSIPLLGTTLVDTTTLSAPGRPLHYSAMVAGSRHACGMPRLPAPQVPWCWGSNSSGQLGTGNTTDSLRPAPVVMPVGVTAFDSTSLVAGEAHTCALVSAGTTIPVGTAFCWGSNASGQLGLGTFGIGTPPVISAADSVPTQVIGPTFVRLYAGPFTTCCLDATGVAYCWGLNSSGQLGSNGTANSATPLPVAGGLSFANLAMGEQHTCGITGVPVAGGLDLLGAAGTIYCWGNNQFGQAGTGQTGTGTTPLSAPTRVSFQQ
jgi:alpha-tubulin suppressor-like RCC1 family protein